MMINMFICVMLIAPVTTAPPPPVASAPPPPVSAASPPPEMIYTTPKESEGNTVGPIGVFTTEDVFDDGVFEGVRTVTVYLDSIGVTGIEIQYVANEKFHYRVHGISTTVKVDFEVAFPVEFITSIRGIQSYDEKLATSFISSISFMTSHGRTSEAFGNSTMTSTDFVLEPRSGKKEKLLGFIGSSGERINALGARFGWPSSNPKRVDRKTELVAPESGFIVGGASFHDGIFDGVRTVMMRSNSTCITYMETQYVMGDTFEVRQQGSPSTAQEVKEVEFALEYPEEYITAVVVWWGSVSGDHQVLGVRMMTSHSRYQDFGVYDPSNRKYVLKPKKGLGQKLVGFVGRSGESVNAIGARFELLVGNQEQQSA